MAGRFTIKNTKKILSFLTTGLILVIAFQNCSDGFQSLNSSELSSLSNSNGTGGGGATPTCIEELEAQYVQFVKPIFAASNCVSCHKTGGLAASTRLKLDAANDRALVQSLFALIDKTTPASSTLLTKPTQAVAHTGGQLFAGNSSQASAIKNFIDGALAKNLCIVGSGGPQACANPDSYLQPQIKRLTPVQLGNSMSSVFGNLFQGVTVPNLNDSKPRIGLSNDPDILRVDQINILSLYNYSQAAVAVILAQNTTIRNCVAATGATCFTDTINNFGRRLWRRPLTTDEVTNFTTGLSSVSGASGTRANQMEFILRGLILSPNHLFRTEIGSPSANSLLLLSHYEVASLLSFNMLDYPPDDTLLEAARLGQLHTVANLKTQVNRLAQDARFKTKMSHFAIDLLKIDGVKTAPKDASYNFTTADRDALYNSAQSMLEDIYGTPNASFYAPFSAQRFHSNNLTAKYFNESSAAFNANFTAFNADANERYGILSHPAFLSSISGEIGSGIVKRGVFAIEQLLCHELGNPPANVSGVTNLPPGFDPDKTTSREVLQITHSNQPACIGCHSTIDPAGFGFENFGPTGQFRLVEKTNIPINSSGTISGIAERTLAFDNSVGYFKAMTESQAFKQCMKKKYFKYSMGQEPEARPASHCEFENFDFGTSNKGDTALSMIESLVELKSFINRKAN